MGTPQTLTNAVGECVWEITQDTWGAALEIQMLNKDNRFEQSNLRFQGQYYDNVTGLHYNRYRYYEPYSARYMSKDPIGLFGGYNTSAYVSDPTQWGDPMGLMAEKNKNSNQSNYERYSQDFNRRNALILERQRKATEQAKLANEQAKQKAAEKERQIQLERTTQKRSLKEIYLSDEVIMPSGSTVPEIQNEIITNHCSKYQCAAIKADYLACGGGLLGHNVTIVKNLWADQAQGWYIAGSKVALITQSSPKSSKDLVGASCAVGVITGLDKKLVKERGMEYLTDQFVNGASASAGIVVGPSGGGVTMLYQCLRKIARFIKQELLSLWLELQASMQMWVSRKCYQISRLRK